MVGGRQLAGGPPLCVGARRRSQKAEETQLEEDKFLLETTRTKHISKEAVQDDELELSVFSEVNSLRNPIAHIHLTFWRPPYSIKTAEPWVVADLCERGDENVSHFLSCWTAVRYPRTVVLCTSYVYRLCAQKDDQLGILGSIISVVWQCIIIQYLVGLYLFRKKESRHLPIHPRPN